MRVETDDLITASRIAKRAGVSAPAVWNWIKRDHLRFPEPVFVEDRTHLWLWSEVRDWLTRTGRMENE